MNYSVTVCLADKMVSCYARNKKYSASHRSDCTCSLKMLSSSASNFLSHSSLDGTMEALKYSISLTHLFNFLVVSSYINSRQSITSINCPFTSAIQCTLFITRA